MLYKCIKDICSQNIEELFKQKSQRSTEQINIYFKIEISRKTFLIAGEILEQPHIRGSFSSLSWMSLWEVDSMTVELQNQGPRAFLLIPVHTPCFLTFPDKPAETKKTYKWPRTLNQQSCSTQSMFWQDEWPWPNDRVHGHFNSFSSESMLRVTVWHQGVNNVNHCLPVKCHHCCSLSNSHFKWISLVGDQQQKLVQQK